MLQQVVDLENRGYQYEAAGLLSSCSSNKLAGTFTPPLS